MSTDVLGRRAAASRVWRRWIGFTVLAVIALLFLVPLLFAVSASLKTLDKVVTFPPSLWVSDPQWSNYPAALAKLPFARFMVNSFVIASLATVGQVLSAALVGYAFARMPWRGREGWFLVLLATMMLPSQVVMIPHYLLYKELGWLGTWKPLIVPSWLGGGAFSIFLFRQTFKSMPREFEEAARLDGCTEFQIWWRIYLPNAKAVLATAATLGFIGHWKDFLGPLIYLSDFETYPISVGLQMYQTLEGSWTNYLMAASLVATLPLVVLFAVCQRFLVKGMLLSGSKG